MVKEIIDALAPYLLKEAGMWMSTVFILALIKYCDPMLVSDFITNPKTQDIFKNIRKLFNEDRHRLEKNWKLFEAQLKAKIEHEKEVKF